MAAIKFKTAKGIERGCEEGFGGINDCARNRSGTNKCSLLENLDIGSDGTLVTRSGYEHKYSFPAEIRGTLNSAGGVYVAAGNTLYYTDTQSGNTDSLCTLPSNTGEVDLFYMSGILHLLDGTGLYRYVDSAFIEVEGYAPLYGNDWDPSERGEICEDINVVSDRLRITYLLTEDTTEFNLGLCAKSLDRLEVNGQMTELEIVTYSFVNEEQSIIKLLNTSAGQRITFFITLAESSSARNRLKRLSKAFVFTSNGGERLCIYHPGISNSFLSSRIISEDAYTISKKTAADSLAIYLPLSSSITPSNGASLINGMARHFDRALLFTESDTWCVDFEGAEPEVSRILPKVFLLNSAIGSELYRGDAHCGNDPLSFYRGGLWQWHSQSGIRDECSASLISDGAASLLPKEPECVIFLSVPHKQEIWVADPDDPLGRILIYNAGLDTWTTYSAIFAERFLLCGEHPAFIRGSEIYIFTDERFDDLEDKDTNDIIPVKSKLTSHFCDFGTPELDKRSLRIIFDCERAEDEISILFENEKGEIRSLPIRDCAAPGTVSERLILPRFRKIRYTISSSSGRVKYNSIILSAK